MQRYFKTGKGEYAEGDVFLGVRMSTVFRIAKDFVGMDGAGVKKLLNHQWHEARVGGVCILDWEARRKKTPDARRKELCQLYLDNHQGINNWDIVDRGAMYVVGGYLFDKKRYVLYRLAKSKNIWERRMAIVSTGYFIRQRDLDDTFRIAAMLLNDKEDLIHKPTGWMLRFAGDKDRVRLVEFLEMHAAVMPRTMLRYAIEKFDKPQRDCYLSLRKK